MKRLISLDNFEQEFARYLGQHHSGHTIGDFRCSITNEIALQPVINVKTEAATSPLFDACSIKQNIQHQGQNGGSRHNTQAPDPLTRQSSTISDYVPDVEKQQIITNFLQRGCPAGQIKFANDQQIVEKVKNLDLSFFRRFIMVDVPDEVNLTLTHYACTAQNGRPKLAMLNYMLQQEYNFFAYNERHTTPLSILLRQQDLVNISLVLNNHRINSNLSEQYEQFKCMTESDLDDLTQAIKDIITKINKRSFQTKKSVLTSLHTLQLCCKIAYAYRLYNPPARELGWWENVPNAPQGAVPPPPPQPMRILPNPVIPPPPMNRAPEFITSVNFQIADARYQQLTLPPENKFNRMAILAYYLERAEMYYKEIPQISDDGKLPIPTYSNLEPYGMHITRAIQHYTNANEIFHRLQPTPKNLEKRVLATLNLAHLYLLKCKLTKKQSDINNAIQLCGQILTALVPNTLALESGGNEITIAVKLAIIIRHIRGHLKQQDKQKWIDVTTKFLIATIKKNTQLQRNLSGLELRLKKRITGQLYAELANTIFARADLANPQQGIFKQAYDGATRALENNPGYPVSHKIIAITGYIYLNQIIAEIWANDIDTIKASEQVIEHLDSAPGFFTAERKAMAYWHRTNILMQQVSNDDEEDNADNEEETTTWNEIATTFNKFLAAHIKRIRDNKLKVPEPFLEPKLFQMGAKILGNIAGVHITILVNLINLVDFYHEFNSINYLEITNNIVEDYVIRLNNRELARNTKTTLQQNLRNTPRTSYRYACLTRLILECERHELQLTIGGTNDKRYSHDLKCLNQKSYITTFARCLDIKEAMATIVNARNALESSDWSSRSINNYTYILANFAQIHRINLENESLDNILDYCSQLLERINEQTDDKPICDKRNKLNLYKPLTEHLTTICYKKLYGEPKMQLKIFEYIYTHKNLYNRLFDKAEFLDHLCHTCKRLGNEEKEQQYSELRDKEKTQHKILSKTTGKRERAFFDQLINQAQQSNTSKESPEPPEKRQKIDHNP